MKKLFLALLVIGLITSCNKTDQDLNTSVSGISIPNSLAFNLDQTKKIEVEIIPVNGSQNVDLLWSSSNPDVATVDSDGNITATAMGKSVIKVMLKENPNIYAKCDVTVGHDIVEFEDPNFAAWLLDFDSNNDGAIQKCEASVVQELLLPGRKIKSLKGIEYFTNLILLDCSRNELTELDLSKNKMLKALYCKGNTIQTINISESKYLEILNCSNNRLSAIDVTHNPQLKVLRCSMNNGSMSPDNYGIREIDVTKNPELEVLDVYYLNISKIDVTENPKLKSLNIGHSCYTLEGKFTPIETIDLSNNPELEDLNCIGGNEPGFGLRSLDVTHNTKLRQLVTYGNPRISELDLSKNIELSHLNCSHNGLRELDLTKCPGIDTVSCEWNQIAVLDLRQCVELKYLNCANNSIAELDFSNTQLGYLLAQNNKITKITMGEKTFDTPHSSAVSGTITSKPYLYMKLNDNLISEIDLSKQKYLHWIEISNNKLRSLNVSSCAQLGGLHCANNQLSELVLGGISRIWELRCENNTLTGVLDLSAMNLTRISIENNQLKDIKVLKGFNPNDTYLYNGKSFPCYTKDALTNWIY